MNGYSVFENELHEWFIGAPHSIRGPFETQEEAENILKNTYPHVESYVVLPYSEMAEWTNE